MSYSVSREDKAFNKLEKAVERLFDLGFSLDSIIGSASIRYGELAHPDYVTEAAEGPECGCKEPGDICSLGKYAPCHPECVLDKDHDGECMLPEVVGWCDACGLEVRDPESRCPAQEERPEDSFPSWTVEKIIEFTKRLEVLEDRLRKPTAVINEQPWVQPFPSSPQFGGMGQTWHPIQRPQNTCTCDHH